MDFKFIHSKIIEDLNNKITFFLFYLGYDLHKFTSDMLDVLNMNNGAIFIINFNNNLVDKLNREGTHKIIKTETNKRHNLYLNSNGIFSLTSKVLLLDLITNKLSSDAINYLIILNDKQIENDSKEIFIMKYLLHNTKKTKFIILNNNPINFCSDFNIIKMNKIISTDNFKINFLSRNHPIIDKTIEYSMNVKNIQIYEYNIINEELNELQNKLILLYNNCKDELKRLSLTNVKNTDQVQFENFLVVFKLENIISCNSTSTIHTLINHNLFNYRTRVLIKDLIITKNFIMKLDYYDYSSLLYIFNKIVRESDELSFFRYKDSHTILLIDSIQEILKRKIFTIIKNENSNKIEKIITNEYIEKVIDFSERNISILENYSISINPSNFNFNSKPSKLLEILSNINSNSNNVKEKILIITNSNSTRDSIKEILSSFFILKDECETFYEKKIRNFLTAKSEYQKRQKVITSQSINSNLNYISPILIENILLHKLCVDLCFKYDVKNESIFEKLLLINNSACKNESDDNMPSEIDVTENMFVKLDSTSFDEKGKNIMPPHFLFVENFNINEESIRIQELILKENISVIIFHHFDLEIIRLIESTISNNEESCIKKIHIINSVNTYNFKKEIFKAKDEIEIFKNIYKNYHIRLGTGSFNNNVSKNKLKVEKEIKPLNSNNTMNKNIVIDFREMSSKLPFYLYDFGFNLVVGGLEIGDYITSNSVCIERKSITSGDLYESLKSGRLMNQIVKMQKYFEYLIILCEFEDDMEISVKDSQSLNKSNTESHFFKQKFLYKKFIELKSMSCKIHIVWSKNPKMTSVLLNMLKNKYTDFLDVHKCLNINKKDNTISTKNNININIAQTKANNKSNQASIVSFFGGDNLETNKTNEIENLNSNSSTNISNYEEENDNFDPNKKMEINIERFLRKIDGITNINYNLIFKSFLNLKEFIMANREKLNSIFGVINGNKIFFFLNSRYNNKKK